MTKINRLTIEKCGGCEGKKKKKSKKVDLNKLLEESFDLNEKKATPKQLEARKKFIEMINKKKKGKKNKESDDELEVKDLKEKKGKGKKKKEKEKEK